MQQHWADTRSIERVCCFWCKSVVFLSAKLEVELILTMAHMEKISLMSNISKMVRDTKLDTKDVR